MRQRKIEGKRNLTTGQIGRLCGVNFRTVVRWIERGWLKAYTLPGRGDRRIAVPALITFLRDYGIPIPPELVPLQRRVALVAAASDQLEAVTTALLEAGFEIETAHDLVAAGLLLDRLQPAVVVLDLELAGPSATTMLEAIGRNPSLEASSVLLLSTGGAASVDRALAEKAAGVLDRELEPRLVVAAVAEAAGIPPAPGSG